jgi:hypothetical protein
MDRALILLAQEKIGAGELPGDPLAKTFGGQAEAASACSARRR